MTVVVESHEVLPNCASRSISSSLEIVSLPEFDEANRALMRETQEGPPRMPNHALFDGIKPVPRKPGKT